MCDGTGSRPAFPYVSRWQSEQFAYRACADCETRFIDPAPSAALLASIYAPASYHDLFYDEDSNPAAVQTARLLAQHLPKGSQLRSGGTLSAEGPLEANPSLVRFATVLAGWLKLQIRPGSIAEFPPYHLLFTNGAAQQALFKRLETPLVELAWQVEETGWPYRGQGQLRGAIARLAIAAARVMPGWGNRYRTLLRVEG